jgi:hypothetical protein
MQLSSKQREAISKAIDDHVEGTLGFRYEVLDAIERIVSGPHTAQRGFIGPDSPDAPAPAPLALMAHEWREQYGDEATARVGFKAPGTVTGMVDGALWLALHMAASQPAPLADAERAELATFRALRDEAWGEGLGQGRDASCQCRNCRLARVGKGE